MPKVIYKTSSKYNSDIEVVESKGVKRLVVNDQTQSIDPNSPQAEKMVWGRAVRLIKEEVPELHTLMLLGLGGGTMPHILHREFPGVVIVSVEIDDVMVNVAKHYFDVDKIPNHYIIVDDACRVIIQPETFNLKPQSFQVLVVDIFVGDEYPDLGESGNFLAHVCKMVMPGGLIIFNRFYFEDHQEDVHEFIDNVEMYLDDVKTTIVPGKTNSDNLLIYGRVR